MEKKVKNLMDSFFNEYDNDFTKLMDSHREKKLLNREDYKEISDEAKEIINKNPNIKKYLQNEEIVGLTDKEKESILNYIGLQEEIKLIEQKEAFKLGAKEAYIYFEEMDMLNI